MDYLNNLLKDITFLKGEIMETEKISLSCGTYAQERILNNCSKNFIKEVIEKIACLKVK